MTLAGAALALCVGAHAKPPAQYQASNGDFLIDLPGGWEEGEWAKDGSAVFHFFNSADKYGETVNLHADRRNSGYLRPEDAEKLARKQREQSTQGGAIQIDDENGKRRNPERFLWVAG